MTYRADDQVPTRSYAARAGITALNLLSPGLGLIRVGAMRVAAMFLIAPFVLIAVMAFGVAHLPITNYAHALIALVAVLTSLAALYGVSAILTWRGSKARLPARGWSRWYGVVAIAVVMIVLAQLAQSMVIRLYKPFYVPSESMEPTIGKGDKFIADMRWRGPLKRGQVVIFIGPGSVRISRIAALPGDRIAMRGGVPTVNGVPARQTLQVRTSFAGHDDVQPASMLAERLPGEEMSHKVLDSGAFEFDDTSEVVVPAGHFFVLGDNRDSSADSRVPASMSGVGMVPVTALIGRPMYLHWSADRAKIGTKLDR